jgi:hypothetical protein
MRGLREGWTKHPWEWLLLLAALAMLITLVTAPRAQGSYHFISIRQVHPDDQGMFSTGDWVELQMYAAGQNFVFSGAPSGAYVRTFDSDGDLETSYKLSADVANGQNQRTILIGNGSSFGPGGVAPDFNAGLTGDLEMTGEDGAVCYTDGPPLYPPIDCVSYGNFPGALPSGNDAPATGFGETLERRITPNCATLLEAADDTNDSATDFALSANPPRNNSATPTETPCAPPPPPPPPPPTPQTPPTVLTPVAFDLAAAIKGCKKKFPKGPKRKKCIRKAKRRAAAG